jgi:NAD(P)-dependent dehydrogenase (short-subunit alcohol dehydrogenase family)
MTQEPRLHDKVTVITGAGRGIGRATALLFARQGARLGLLDKDADEVRKVAKEIEQAGGQAIAVQADVTSPDAVESAIKLTVKKFGPVTVLVNNAGVTLTRPFIETSMADVDFLVGVNLKGVILASQAAIPYMIEAGGGTIVHDASNAGIVGRPWQSVYGATKAGVVSLTKSMALTLAKNNIRVNCICPGSIDTPMLRAALATSGDFDTNWRRSELVIPLGRIGLPDDIAYATLFLASNESKYITGIALPVDGGRTAGIAETSHLTMEAK